MLDSYVIRLEGVGTRSLCELAEGRVGSLQYNNCMGYSSVRQTA